ncbi:O-antigen polysaccharide polymerase Wzy family protein [Mycolicibacterium sp. PAM1]|uniref:O-antigen polysaccharide polymerase Wzy n=1 Tax=Mycolicibacterium sp. PAM1 TaxID=2853535 RepID=UPI001C3E5EB7|nr:O-antigen polysaccharide polymerase Wzy [Mycolicibacterium sp. PAM1]MBV5246889.1 O-antigen polysaccharide polymerase Wzy family protein [Mycolicibacterium sp. PAM1]
MVAAVWRPLVIKPELPTYVSAEFLFLFWSYLIFFYPYQLHVLGIHDIAHSRYSVLSTFSEQANHAVVLSLIGTVAFRGGLRTLKRPPAAGTLQPSSLRRLDRLGVEDLALPLLALQVVLLVAYQFFGWRAAGEGRYSGTTAGGTLAQGVYLGITILSMVAVALWICVPQFESSKRPILLTLSALLSVAWAARLLVAGDRNTFLLIAIVTIGALFTFRIRAGRWLLIVFCGVAVALYQAIEELRAGRISSLLEFFTNTPSDSDSSLNLSAISVRAALSAVPEYIDYGYGIYQVVGLAGVIPFIRGAVISPDASFTQSSDVLNAILLMPSARWGLGTNVVTDAYTDFGFIGVPTLLFIVGLGVAYIQKSVRICPTSPWRVTFYLVSLALVAEMPRYALTFPVRPLTWVLFFFVVVSFLTPQMQLRITGAKHRPREASTVKTNSK